MKKIILQPKRQYGIDLLRMISMMIVVNHTLRRSSLLDITPLGSVSHEVLWAVSGLSSLHLIEKLLVLALIGIGVFLVCDVADLGREWLFRHIGVPKFGAWLDRKIELRDKEVGQ